jgi:hypothetical protein
MRARGTWLVVGGIAALAIAAVVDVLPTDVARRDVAQSVETTPRERPPRPPGTFDAGGILFYTDELCRLRAARLPGLDPVEGPDWHGCEFSLSPDGDSVVAGGIVWQPQGRLRATAVSGLVYVVRDDPVAGYRRAGHAPAFKPDGTATFVHDGDVVELTPSCLSRTRTVGCERVLLTRRELTQPLLGDPNAPEGRSAIATATVTAIAWFTPTRLAAAFSFSEHEDLIAVYEGETLLRTITGFGGSVVKLLVSPRHRYAAAHLERPNGFVLFDPEGDTFVLEEVQRDFSGRPPFTGGRAIAWSPDDKWTAIARRRSVVLFRMGPETPDVVHLDLSAHDLAWVTDEVRAPAPDHTGMERR